MSAPPPILALDGITSGYGAAMVVQGVSLSLHSGEIVAVLGKNGMGKSTLLKTVMGLSARPRARFRSMVRTSRIWRRTEWPGDPWPMHRRNSPCFKT